MSVLVTIPGQNNHYHYPEKCLDGYDILGKAKTRALLETLISNKPARVGDNVSITASTSPTGRRVVHIELEES